MKSIWRRVLAIVALVLFVPFLVFFIMALGAYQLPNGLAPALASAFGLTVLLIFLFLKTDEIRRRRMTEAEEAILRDKLGVEGVGDAASAGTAGEDAVTETASEETDAPAANASDGDTKGEKA